MIFGVKLEYLCMWHLFTGSAALPWFTFFFFFGWYQHKTPISPGTGLSQPMTTKEKDRRHEIYHWGKSQGMWQSPFPQKQNADDNAGEQLGHERFTEISYIRTKEAAHRVSISITHWPLLVRIKQVQVRAYNKQTKSGRELRIWHYRNKCDVRKKKKVCELSTFKYVSIWTKEFHQLFFSDIIRLVCTRVDKREWKQL